VLQAVCAKLEAVDDAQIEFGLFRGCLAYNKINLLLRTCPPSVLHDAVKKFDEHFRGILEKILRVPCVADDVWEHASLPTRFSGLGVTQTKAVAAAAYVGSCALTHDLVCSMLRRDPSSFLPSSIEELLLP
jgi:hypothetical protein